MQLYGSWLCDCYDFDEFCKKATGVQETLYPVFLRRVEAVGAIGDVFVQEAIAEMPALQGKIFCSYPSLIAAIGRYINDIMHYKLWHDVKVANKAKMISHTIKWLSHYPVIVTNISADEFKALSTAEQKFVLDANTYFIGTVVRYFLSHFCGGLPPSASTYEKIFYLLDTAQYDAKTAAVAFEAIII